MNYKNFVKGILLFLGIILIFSLITTLLYHNNLISKQIVQILKIISLALSSITSGFYIGLKSKNKGYINGLTLGGILTGIILILKLIISKKLTLLSIIVYILIIILITSSSILGINKRK